MGKDLNRKNNNNFIPNQNNILNKKYFTNTKQNEISENINNNISSNKNNNIITTFSEEEDYSDIERIILEKGTELRNDFHIQLK